MQTVRVPLGDRGYDIHAGKDLLDGLGDYCTKLGLKGRCAIISDTNVFPLWGKRVIKSLTSAGFATTSVVVPAGESSKRIRTVERCLETLALQRLERKSFIVALGGGVVGDLAGFVAATYLRGIDFVQVPTTLLSQVDSSVGGKVGVNLKAGKNLVGAFYQPRLVLCDLGTLRTLPLREYRAGIAEVIKYGIIYDKDLFKRLERDLPLLLRRETKTLSEIVARCCAIKAEVVGQDETEGGLRAILNYGHTIGHALENISGYGTYLHGEAISIGQVAASRISNQLFGMPSSDVERVCKLFKRAGLPVKVKLNRTQMTRLLEAMKLDKKVSGGEVKFVLASKIGSVEYGKSVPIDVIMRSLESAAESE